jgi:hypothetical protein
VIYSRNRISGLLLAALLLTGSAAVGHASPPPPPWAAKDIGKATARGIVDVNALRLWTLRAANGDIGILPKQLDDFFFVYQPLVGDGSILALILGQEGGNPEWSKAGIMMRENDAPGARNLLLGMTTGHGMLLTFRPVANRGTMLEGADQQNGSRRFPTWLRLQREGDRFTPFTSSDGFGWTQLHSPITLPRFPRNALAGLAISAYREGPTAAAFNSPMVVPGQISPIVQTCTGNGSVLLTWPPVSNAAGYLVRRSAPGIPGFAAELLTPSPIRETSFADSGLPNGEPLRYLVSALFDPGGQLVESLATAVTATPVWLPGDLFGCDINLEATQLHGAITFDPSTEIYSISGAGGDMSGTADRGYFASRWVRGDFQITTRILDKPTRTGIGARAGVMVRESLEGPSRMVFLAGTAAVGVVFQSRRQTGGDAAIPTKAILPDQRFRVPLFLRLVRRGNTITPFLSADGTAFTPAGKPQRFAPPLAESLYVGYAITAQNPGAIATNSFSDLTIGPPPR